MKLLQHYHIGGDNLTDVEILDLYWARSELAIGETAQQYGPYCLAIALNILRNREDSDECVNDTYLNAWNAIPPQRPSALSAFLGRITRNLSFDRYKARKAQKRYGNETALILSELEDCIPSSYKADEEIEARVLEETIDNFLTTVGKDDRVFFVRRYWYADSISGIAKRFVVNESRVKTSLFRTRNKLRIILEREGILV